VAHNTVGQAVKPAATGRLVDWEIDTWSVVPGAEFNYEWTWKRSVFEFGSRYNFFHTESFNSSSPLVSVKGDSHTWENKLDVDVPLGWKVFGRELHTGGFVSRTALFGGVADGLNADHLYTLNGRVVVDLLGAVWRLAGGRSYVADHFSGCRRMTSGSILKGDSADERNIPSSFHRQTNPPSVTSAMKPSPLHLCL
jgi:hypothetical protein